MPKLIKNQQVIDDAWQLLQEGDAIPAEGKIIVPLATWQEQKSSLRERGDVGVWLDSDQPPEPLADDVDTLPVIAINFPKFADGRGFSYARELRQRHGFQGELRAVGAFIRDQLFFLKRCGFDAYALEIGDIDSAVESLEDFSEVYQAGIDQPLPLFNRR